MRRTSPAIADPGITAVLARREPPVERRRQPGPDLRVALRRIGECGEPRRRSPIPESLRFSLVARRLSNVAANLGRISALDLRVACRTSPPTWAGSPRPPPSRSPPTWAGSPSRSPPM